MQAQSKKQLKDKLNYLLFLKDKMEKDSPMVGKMLKWQALPPEEKNRITQEWEEYYQAVKSSRAYQRFYQQKEAFKAGMMSVVKALAEEARKDLEEKTDWIPKPTSIDPNQFDADTSCERYRWILKAIEETKDLLRKAGDTEALAEEIFEK